MAKILIVRFSALGDIAMTVPVITEFARQYPEHSITVLSRKFAEPLFRNLAANVNFCGIDLKVNRYKGIKGIYNLYRELSKSKYDYFVDFHDVLRTKLLRTFFRLGGCRVSSIDKERQKRKRFLKTKDSRLRLRTSFERYTLALNKLGFRFTNNFKSVFGNCPPDLDNIKGIEKYSEYLNGKKLIGIAPFTTHRGKEYPSGKMEQVVMSLSMLKDTAILLFGGGEREKRILEEWQAKYDNVISVAGKFDMRDELTIMSHLKVMVSMDSANMHLASLAGTTVISIWGATSPECGFLGWNQSEDNAIQLNLPCRPCSVFGNKKCIFADYRCLENIEPASIVRKITGQL